jgi:hypothetical protein
MKSRLLPPVVACLVGVGATYAILEFFMNGERRDALAKVLNVQAEVASTRNELLGFTKYTDYLSAGKQVVSEKMKFLAAKVVREYVLVENIQKETLKLKSDATVIVKYSVEYSFGFDLKPDSFEIAAIPAGIQIKISKPSLVASPAVTPISSEIPNVGLLTDEKMAVINIHQKLPGLAKKHGEVMALEEPVRALCEKQLIEFLRDFLAKQPGVKQVPAISIVYK